ncbi:unnamed protein product [Urochloa humidicola]
MAFFLGPPVIKMAASISQHAELEEAVVQCRFVALADGSRRLPLASIVACESSKKATGSMEQSGSQFRTSATEGRDFKGKRRRNSRSASTSSRIFFFFGSLACAVHVMSGEAATKILNSLSG